MTSWNDDRGFGFLAPDDGGEDVFIHIKSLPRKDGRPTINARYSFEVQIGPNGKKRATNVVAVGRSVSRPQGDVAHDPLGFATLFAIPAFLFVYAAVTFLWQVPLLVDGLYLLMSAVTLIVYALDKSASVRGTWRTSESTLHALALACGWPGALIAQQLLRHKSSKAEFRAVFWLTVAVNIVAFVALSSPVGREILQR